MRVGIIGVGNMGGAMCRRLGEQGVDTVVFDLRTDIASALGVPVSQSARSLAADCPIVILSLPTAAHVQAVIDDTIDAYAEGAVVIDTTTSLPNVSRAVGARLAARRVHYLDVGVSGGPHGAAAGALKVMVGGTDEAFALAEPTLQLIGARIWRCGAIGTGHAMKAVLNLANQNKMLVEIEALALGAKSGLDPHLVCDVLDLAVWKEWAFGDQGRRPFGFPLALFAKDFDVANAVATDAGVTLLVGGAGQQLARMLRKEAGDSADLVDAVAVIERWNDVRFDSGPTT